MEHPEHERFKEFFRPSRSLTEEEIRQYAEEAAEEAFRIENVLLDSPLDSDAVEGYASANYDFDKEKPFDDFNTFLQKMRAGQASKRLRFNRRKTFWNRMAAVAAVAIIALFSILILRPAPPTDATLFAQNYEFYPSGQPTFRGAAARLSDNLDTPLSQAMQAYEKKDFELSAAKFEAVLESDPSNPSALFFAALSNLETGAMDEAIALFKKVKKLGQRYSEEASWYLILSYLKKGDEKQAQTLLEDYLKSGHHFKHDKALILQQKLGER